ncbi:unnamed protein product [Phyllotreta striolata]|uniref:THAP-type domain-containing protein n=1 Tax=Phyllotreta striolata TaxID=444603 RepID=A0A9N9TEK1_PHYSR|nr:unnamed protein product [Phyllotreta striolata]
MTGTVCYVATCKSNSERAKKEGELIRFFTFPKKKEVLKQWVRLCRRKSPFDPKNKRICSKHFALDQYEDMIEAQIKNTMPKRLKETAIPSLNLPLVPEHTISQRSKRMELKEQKRIVESLLIDEAPKENASPQDMSACSSNSLLQDISNHQSQHEILNQKYIALKEQCEKLKNQAQQDKAEIENLITTNKKLQLSADHSQNTLNAKVYQHFKDGHQASTYNKEY